MGVPNMDGQTFTDSELDYHVTNALKSAIEGDSDFYNQLVAVLHHKERLAAEEVALLVTCLKAVAGAVSCIDIVHHRSLIAAIVGMNMWDYGTDVMDALVELIVSLASSSAEYIDLCLDMLVTNFMPLPPSASARSVSYYIGLLKQPRGVSKKIEVLDRIHSALRDISKLVPLTPLRLEKVVRDRMPNIYTKETFMVMYVENMLRLESGEMGELVGTTVLATLMDRLTELDVDLSWDDILEDDFHKGMFDMELEDLELLEDHNEPAGNEVTHCMTHRELLIQKFFSGNLVAEKLESLMVLTFEYLNSCSESGRLIQVFEILLQSFKKTVLTAYKSKFAQFVMFYACSLDPENCGTMFANALVDIYVTGVNPEWRMSAVAYLASYLARAKFIPVSFVASMLERVASYCFLYCKNKDGGVNPKAHKLFYAGCQAIMYVLCFHMKQMLAVPQLKSQLLSMHIDDIFGHPFKPLQVCLLSVVKEFLRLVKANHIFSLPETLVEEDGLSEHSVVFRGLEIQRLDPLFPFDPCLLRRCDSYIRPNYVYWSTVRSSYDEEDDDDEEGTSDEDIADADDCGNGMSIPDNRSVRSYEEGDSDPDEFDCNFDKMSITPRDNSHKFGGRMQRFTQMPSKIRPSTSPESL